MRTLLTVSTLFLSLVSFVYAEEPRNEAPLKNQPDQALSGKLVSQYAEKTSHGHGIYLLIRTEKGYINAYCETRDSHSYAIQIPEAAIVAQAYINLGLDSDVALQAKFAQLGEDGVENWMITSISIPLSANQTYKGKCVKV